MVEHVHMLVKDIIFNIYYALIQRMFFRLMKNKTVEPTSISSTESNLENVCNQNAHSEKKEDSTAATIIALAVFTAIAFVAFLGILIVYLKKTRHGKLQYY